MKNWVLALIAVPALAMFLCPVWCALDGDTTMSGKVMDLHSFLTGKHKGDPAKSIQSALSKGTPAVLETDDGSYLVGSLEPGSAPARAAMKQLQALAYQDVEVRGKVFRKGSLRFIDISSVRAGGGNDDDDDEDDGDDDEDDEGDE